MEWIRLDPADRLFVEVAEDYAKFRAGALDQVQVRRTATPITLATKGVRGVLERHWRLKATNPQARITTTYLTTSGAGREKRSPLPAALTGLAAWHDAATTGRHVEGVRDLLLALTFPDEMKQWIRGLTADAFRIEFLQTVSWRLEAAGLPEFKTLVVGAFRERCRYSQLLPREADKILPCVTQAVLELAAHPGARELTAEALQELIDTHSLVAVHPSVLRRRATELKPYRPPVDLRQRDDDGDRLFFFAAADRTAFVGRDDLLQQLREWARERTELSWTLLTGPGGLGKSRLALELCISLRGEGWDAGFLTRSSDLSSPPRFADFRPLRPTLLVIDYVSLSPAWAGQVIRTLIDASLQTPFEIPVRVLLLERTGPPTPWWSEFVGQHAQQMTGRARRLAGDRYLDLKPLEADALWSVFQEVAPNARHLDREFLLVELRRIDPRGTPLFAALAAEAYAAGRELRQFSRQGLLADIFERERARWAAACSNPDRLSRHERAAALATLVGGIEVITAGKAADPAYFPFARDHYDGDLAAALTGMPPFPDILLPMEPDILGESFVLQKLQPESPFDSGPEALKAATATLAAGDEQKRWDYVGFRVRLAQDFPAEALATGLYDAPPTDAAPELHASWAGLMATVFEYLAEHGTDLTRLHQQLVDLRLRFPTARAVQVSTSAALAAYAAVLAREGAVSSAMALFEPIDWGTVRGADGDAASDLGRAAYVVGVALLAAGERPTARVLLDNIRKLAVRLRDAAPDHAARLREDAAALALQIGAASARDGDFENARIIEQLLWKRTTVGPDLALAAAEVLVTWDEDFGLGEPEDVADLILRRADERRDLPDLQGWAAESLLRAMRDAYFEPEFAGLAERLSAWVIPRLGIASVSTVVRRADQEDWLDRTGRLGAESLRTLHALWCASVAAATDAGVSADDDPLVSEYCISLKNGLKAARDASWLPPLLDELGTVPA